MLGLLALAWIASGCEQPAPPDVAAPDLAAPPPAPAAPDGPRAPEAVAPADGSGAGIVPVPGAPASFADLVEQVQPGVVYISTTQVQQVQRRVAANPFFGAPSYGVPEARIAESLGSGFIIDDDGHILTNSHVIEGATSIRVTFHDGTVRDADIVGVDPLTDIAVIRVEPFDAMLPLPLANSDDVRVGEWVIAVGNPFGLSFTVTAGIISARGRRDIPLQGSVRYRDFIQTDASINPGNSGGPLVDMHGRVVGINTAVNREGQGISFAIPINMARAILGRLVDEGHVSRAWLGVYIDDVDQELALALELAEARGALVTRVVAGGPAEVAGLRAGDVITRFGDSDVANGDDLAWIASNAGVGSSVTLHIVRDGVPTDVPVTLGELPE